MKLTRRILLLATALSACRPPAARAAERLVTGVNLAGLEFNRSRLPGEINRDFVAPGAVDLDYFRSRGARAVRLPFLWERLQPRLDDAFDDDHWRRIRSLIDAARDRGMRLVLDPHQYGRRRHEGELHIIGESPQVRAEHFAAFWRELARRCQADAHVLFGLMNEPHHQDPRALVVVHNLAIAAIRETGADNLILVPGGAWSGAHSWISSGNAEVMPGVRDPAERMAFEVHQYLDRDSSGTSADCAAGAGRRLERFTEWARRHGVRGFLGEFGAGSNAVCLAELDVLLAHIAANRDVWIGWTAWAGGPWWPDDYPLTLQPAAMRDPVDRPQMAVLRRYFE